MPDQTTLLLRIGDTLEILEEILRSIDHAQIDVEMTAERALHEFTFVLSEQTVVHEDAGELIADRACQQGGHHGGVDATRQTADHPTITDLGLHSGTFRFHEFAHLPASGTTADAEEEVSQNVDAVRRVRHLGVELHAEEGKLVVHDRGERTGVGVGERGEVVAQTGDLITMTHPDRSHGGNAAEQSFG